MKKTLLSICALALAANIQVVEAGNANIYATGLKVVNDGSEIQFTLNAPGDVKVNFYNGNEKVHTIEKTDLEKGVHTLPLVGIFPNTVNENDQLSWEVVASSEANTEVAKFSDNTVTSQQFYSVTSIAVETNPKLETFGRVYVANAQIGNEQGDGVYILDANLEDVTKQGKTAYSGNVAWQDPSGSARSPFKLALDNEGNLFIGDCDKANSGVYVMNTLQPQEDFKPLFKGTRDDAGLVTNEEGEAVHGKIWSLCVSGEGVEKTLITYDENLFKKVRSTDSDYSASPLFKYVIGNTVSDWSGKYTVFYTNTGKGNAGNIDGAFLGNIVADNYGGVWMSQNQATGGVWNPIIHINSNGTLDCYTSDSWKDVLSIAINKDNTKLAVSKSSSIYLYDVTYDNGTPTLSSDNIITVETGVGNSIHALSFDVAENIYVGGTAKEFIEAYALPKADNTYTTPANEMITVSKTMTGVEFTIADDNTHVEYFNMQGVKVANPENGIFIKKQGTKATKVIL